MPRPEMSYVPGRFPESLSEVGIDDEVKIHSAKLKGYKPVLLFRAEDSSLKSTRVYTVERGTWKTDNSRDVVDGFINHVAPAIKSPARPDMYVLAFSADEMDAASCAFDALELGDVTAAKDSTEGKLMIDQANKMVKKAKTVKIVGGIVTGVLVCVTAVLAPYVASTIYLAGVGMTSALTGEAIAGTVGFGASSVGSAITPAVTGESAGKKYGSAKELKARGEQLLKNPHLTLKNWPGRELEPNTNKAMVQLVPDVEQALVAASNFFSAYPDIMDKVWARPAYREVLTNTYGMTKNI